MPAIGERPPDPLLRMTAFQLTTDQADTGRVVAVRGDLDIATVPDLRAAVDAVLEAGMDCMLNLTECSFIDSSGTRAIAAAAERFAAAGRVFTLHCPTDNRPVRFVVDLVGLADVMTVTPGDTAAS